MSTSEKTTVFVRVAPPYAAEKRRLSALRYELEVLPNKAPWAVPDLASTIFPDGDDMISGVVDPEALAEDCRSLMKDETGYAPCTMPDREIVERTFGREIWPLLEEFNKGSCTHWVQVTGERVDIPELEPLEFYMVRSGLEDSDPRITSLIEDRTGLVVALCDALSHNDVPAVLRDQVYKTPRIDGWGVWRRRSQEATPPLLSPAYNPDWPVQNYAVYASWRAYIDLACDPQTTIS